jgi:hypothetical protein
MARPNVFDDMACQVSLTGPNAALLTLDAARR